jgi:hypothetical protein
MAVVGEEKCMENAKSKILKGRDLLVEHELHWRMILEVVLKEIM